jgi:hypothetical protein
MSFLPRLPNNKTQLFSAALHKPTTGKYDYIRAEMGSKGFPCCPIFKELKCDHERSVADGAVIETEEGI